MVEQSIGNLTVGKNSADFVLPEHSGERAVFDSTETGFVVGFVTAVRLARAVSAAVADASFAAAAAADAARETLLEA